MSDEEQFTRILVGDFKEPIPYPWQAYFDKHNQEILYFNPETGKTSHSFPSPLSCREGTQSTPSKAEETETAADLGSVEYIENERAIQNQLRDEFERNRHLIQLYLNKTPKTPQPKRVRIDVPKSRHSKEILEFRKEKLMAEMKEREYKSLVLNNGV